MIKVLITLLLPILLTFSIGVHADEKININTATIEELDKGLKGVGKRIAKEIVRHREDHGAFKSFEDLDKVKYIGNKLIQRNKKRITFD
ncbi:MAG: helix-hairpin-helix domain-containing protein [Endozoicomonas sp. (ex Botrylloides leachii)]|nr:helix-hairpin-helix domain-containing protein [Endozoicomonas sp. (ex Botrylloides leachii)]